MTSPSQRIVGNPIAVAAITALAAMAVYAVLTAIANVIVLGEIFASLPHGNSPVLYTIGSAFCLLAAGGLSLTLPTSSVIVIPVRACAIAGIATLIHGCLFFVNVRQWLQSIEDQRTGDITRLFVSWMDAVAETQIAIGVVVLLAVVLARRFLLRPAS